MSPIERRAPDDPLIPALLAVRLAWCARAPFPDVFDPPRVLLAPGTEILDEIEAARELSRRPTPLRLTGELAGGVLELVTTDPDAHARTGVIVPPEVVQDMQAPTILAWIAGRGTLISYAQLRATVERYHQDRGGFISAFGRGDFIHGVPEMLGLSARDLIGVEYVLLAFGLAPDGSRTTGGSPLHRSPSPDPKGVGKRTAGGRTHHGEGSDMDRVRDYYANLGEREWSRLETPSGALEFAVNSRLIGRHLPAGARVLDVGGGPGRYALWLAELGHRVVLADLSPGMLTVARERIASSPHGPNVEDVVEADARDLSAWDDAAFDAALCLGPFYHLPRPDDRDRAASELRRVVRRGGPVFVAFMPRYAFLRRTAAIPEERHRLLDPTIVDRLMHDGIFLNDIAGRFDVGFGAVPSEIAPFFERHGFETIDLFASEGLGAGIEKEMARLSHEDPAAHERLMELIVERASDPSLHGLTTHLLYVGSAR